MAGGIIKDGTGSGDTAKVDTTNRLNTRTVVSCTIHEAAEAGDAVFVSSGAITLTSANQSAILWYQNDECRDVLVTEVFFSVGSSTGGTGSVSFAFRKNATGLSSCVGDALFTNPNFGSSTEVAATSERGAEAATVTGGCATAAFFIALDGTTTLPATLVIPKGKSISVQVTPPAGNSSVVVAVALRSHLIKTL